MKSIIIFLLVAIQVELMAQTLVKGEYYFNRQEMVAVFNFSSDGKFQFFYSYGAIDRNASGSFSVEGSTIKLKSDKVAGNDFTITRQLKKGKGYTFVFEHINAYLLENIRCIFFVDGKQIDKYTNPNGKVHTDFDHCDSVFVQHGLYPDVVTLVKVGNNKNNFFKLSLNPSLEQVSFKGIDLTIINENTLTCLPNYLMKIEDIKFVKP